MCATVRFLFPCLFCFVAPPAAVKVGVASVRQLVRLPLCPPKKCRNNVLKNLKKWKKKKPRRESIALQLELICPAFPRQATGEEKTHTHAETLRAIIIVLFGGVFNAAWQASAAAFCPSGPACAPGRRPCRRPGRGRCSGCRTPCRLPSGACRRGSTSWC